MTNESKNNPVLWIVAIVVVIALVGVGAYYAMSSNKKDDNSNNSSMKQEEGVMVGGAAMLKSKNIVENVSNASNLSTLVTAVKAADLVDVLSGPGPFTVFGPTNDAFAKLPAGTVDTLLKPENKSQLQDILKYHVVPGKYAIADLKDGQTLTTVQGDTVTIKKSGDKTYVNGALIQTSDVFQSNGVAHVIDTVLTPNPSVGGAAMYRTKNLVENVSMAPNLKTLVAAVKAADLVDALSAAGPYTAFGPSDDAFAKLPEGTVATLIKPENKAQLQAILKYHVVSGLYKTSDLTDGQKLKTLNGAELTVKKTGSTIQLVGGESTNVVTITTADVYQSNGVADIIDGVLIPPKA